MKPLFTEKLYKNSCSGYFKDIENCYAAEESGSPHYIQLQFLWPYRNFSAEYYSDEPMTAAERNHIISAMLQGMHFAMDWLYCDGDFQRWKTHFEEMVSKAGSKINRTEFFDRHTETVVRSALRFFLPEHVSKSLTERTELIVKNLLEQADFPHRAQYPEHFVKNATALAGMAFTDLAELHDEEKRSAFELLSENDKMNLWIDLKSGGETGYTEFLKEWYEDSGRE